MSSVVENSPHEELLGIEIDSEFEFDRKISAKRGMVMSVHARVTPYIDFDRGN